MAASIITRSFSLFHPTETQSALLTVVANNADGKKLKNFEVPDMSRYFAVDSCTFSQGR